MTLGDIGRALARYRPVAVTIGIILVVVALLPGPVFEELGPLPGVQGPVQVPAAAAAAAPPTTAATPVTTTPSFGSTATTSFGTTSTDSSSFGTSGSFSDSDFGSDDSSSDFGSSESDSSSFGTTDEDFGSDDEESTEPLSIVASAWAARTGGTPLGSTGVPEGLLPVGKRIGQRDKISFVRLSGGGTELVLTPDRASSRTTTGEVVVSACQITTPNWAPATNLTFEQAPKFDESSCVVGSVDPIGAIVFDLTLFPERDDNRGFALLPTGSSIDYQLNFRPE